MKHETTAEIMDALHDERTALRADNAKLRAACEEMLAWGDKSGWPCVPEWIEKKMRAALAQRGGE